MRQNQLHLGYEEKSDIAGGEYYVVWVLCNVNKHHTRSAIRVTTDPKKVTCEHCIRMMRKAGQGGRK